MTEARPLTLQARGLALARRESQWYKLIDNVKIHRTANVSVLGTL